jgi:hypothetical protein
MRLLGKRMRQPTKFYTEKFLYISIILFQVYQIELLGQESLYNYVQNEEYYKGNFFQQDEFCYKQWKTLSVQIILMSLLIHLERWDRVMWTGLVWLRIGTGGELL